MNASFVLLAATILPTAPVPKDATPNTMGPAPRVATVHTNYEGKIRVYGRVPVKRVWNVEETVIEDGKQVKKLVLQEMVEPEERGLPLLERKGTYATAGGKSLTRDEALTRLKDGTMLLISANGKPVAKAWLRAVSEDTVVMMDADLWHFQPLWGDPPLASTPAPRLTMLGTDDRGRVIAPVTTHPINFDGTEYHDDSWFQGKSDGAAWRGHPIVDSKRAPRPPKLGDAKIVYKSLADIAFTAFDVRGKPVSKENALKKLAAGGLALVAASSRMPDAKYLKGFHDDLLILLSPELLLPAEPLDRTGKSAAPKK